MQIIISAGGGGTRLWPLSTNELPKQFTPLFDNESLLLKTYKRLRKSFEASQIWITTNQKYVEIIQSILPTEFNPEHIISEPQKRDNFAPIISSAAIIAKHTSTAEPLLYVPCDDWLENPTVDDDKFNQALLAIGKALLTKEFDIVTVGIKPAFASTQVGYIQIDSEHQPQVYNKVTKLQTFKEKPNYETAKEYLDSGSYFWHKHNPSFTFESLLKNLQIFWPDIVDLIQKVYTDGFISNEDFSKLPKIAIDPALLEKVQNIGMIGMDVSWNDVGNWEVAHKYLPELASNPNYIQLSGHENKAKTQNPNRKVAFVGVSHLLVVESDEGILIIDPTKSAEVKNVAQYFEDR